MYRSYIHNRESLFPARLEENIEDDAPIRVINPHYVIGLDDRLKGGVKKGGRVRC